MLEHLCDLGNTLQCISAAAIIIEATELVVVQAAKNHQTVSRGMTLLCKKASMWEGLGPEALQPLVLHEPGSKNLSTFWANLIPIHAAT